MQASDFTALVPDSISDVLETMYFTSVVGSGPAEAVQPAPRHYCYTLSFVGQVRGHFGVSLSDGTARSLTANFLGEDEADLTEDEVSESVGELANMFCGSVMSRAGASEKFVLSHPSPLARLPDAAEVSMLEVSTDAGPVLIWVSVDGSI